MIRSGEMTETKDMNVQTKGIKKEIPSLMIREQDPEIHKLFHLGQQLIPNSEWALHFFPAEEHGLRLGGADSHKNPP